MKSNLLKYQGKRVLLLQGPIGPFFYRLSKDLKYVASKVFKINFNGGDCFFFPRDFIPFVGPISDWEAFFLSFVKNNEIDIVLLFGDCRPMHAIARKVSQTLGIEVGVFEEGYVRPDYITLDTSGVNGYSKIPKDPDFYFNNPLLKIDAPLRVGDTMSLIALYSVLYYTLAIFLRPFFPHYKHHRPLKFREALPFVVSFYRKHKYRFFERHIQEYLTTVMSKKFFLVPLQVRTDSQLLVHSLYDSTESFLEEVISSFAKNAPPTVVLVIKHHPIDRGHNDYQKAIAHLASKYSLPKSRWYYIHDQHLPSLLSHARGVVLVNSTVGLQAIHHSCPLKVCGKAIYDFSGMTYQGTLERFWNDAESFKVNQELYERFRNYVITHTQINGSIYKRLDVKTSFAGLVWTNYTQKLTPNYNVSIQQGSEVYQYVQ